MESRANDRSDPKDLQRSVNHPPPRRLVGTPGDTDTRLSRKAADFGRFVATDASSSMRPDTSHSEAIWRSPTDRRSRFCKLLRWSSRRSQPRRGERQHIVLNDQATLERHVCTGGLEVRHLPVTDLRCLRQEFAGIGMPMHPSCPRSCCESLPRVRPQQRHPAGPDAGIQHRPGHQPRRAHSVVTGARAPHPTQDIAHSPATAVEGCQIGYGERSLTGTTRTEAIDRQIEARQFRQRTGEDGGPLATGGGIARTAIVWRSRPSDERRTEKAPPVDAASNDGDIFALMPSSQQTIWPLI
jgi:hypothetical protein